MLLPLVAHIQSPMVMRGHVQGHRGAAANNSHRRVWSRRGFPRLGYTTRRDDPPYDLVR
jgi:hypothetical protein